MKKDELNNTTPQTSPEPNRPSTNYEAEFKRIDEAADILRAEVEFLIKEYQSYQGKK